MRSRLSLHLNSLSLDEILYLEEELDRRKEKYRRNYAVLSVHTDQKVLRPNSKLNLLQLATDMRKFINESCAVGGGTLLAYSPEVSIVLFRSVEGARRSCSSLLSNLPEFNGKGGRDSYKIALRIGLAAGVDTLAPGSARCVKASQLVRRANQYAWKSSGEMILMDENCFSEWPNKHAVAKVPIDVDGLQAYRAVPDILGNANSAYDNEALIAFLNRVSAAGINTLKYDMERLKGGEGISEQSDGVHISRLTLEAYDPRAMANLTFTEDIATGDYPARMEVVRRMLSSMGLALVRPQVNAANSVW